MRHLTPLLLLCACTSQPWVVSESDGLIRLDTTDTSGRTGFVTFDIPVPAGRNQMLFAASVEYPERAFVRSLESPDGEIVYDSEVIYAGVHTVTGAIAPRSTTTLNYPILEDDTELYAGTWHARVGVIELNNNYIKGIGVSARALFKDDSSDTSGTLAVNIFYAGQTRQDPDWVAATEAAVETWHTLYEPLNIDLQIEYFDSDETALRSPTSGSREEYEGISAQTPDRSINVVLIEAIEDDPGLYGIAGGIPGPLGSSSNSAIIVSMSVNAGPDGVYDDQEVRLLAETFAHETTHFLGVFHPVEGGWEAWDSLDDTPECSTQIACLSAFSDAMMFPYPICDTAGVCEPQTVITDEQVLLAHRHVGVD